MAENQTQISKSKYFLGVKLNTLTLAEAKEAARNFLRDNKQYKIFTPNPEMVVKAQKDDYFKNVLNSGDLNLCDGFGLSLFSCAPRITGVDFVLEICKIAAEEGKSVYLLGSGSDDVINNTRQELIKRFPNLKVVGVDKGPILNEISNMKYQILNSEYDSLGKISLVQPDILFVAFGMGKQEKWIQENLAGMPSVRIAMGVGGAFDFISGKIKRAPCFLRKIGLEWMYRWWQEPKRIGRIFNATIKFLYYYVRERARRN